MRSCQDLALRDGYFRAPREGLIKSIRTLPRGDRSLFLKSGEKVRTRLGWREFKIFGIRWNEVYIDRKRDRAEPLNIQIHQNFHFY